MGQQRSNSASRGVSDARGRSRERPVVDRSETEDADIVIVDKDEEEALEREALDFHPRACVAEKPDEPAAADAYDALMRIAGRNPPLTRERSIELARIVRDGSIETQMPVEGRETDDDGDDASHGPEESETRFVRTPAALAAREELAKRNLRFVFLIVRRMRVGRTRLKLPFVDAIQEGWMGFLRGVDKFDPDRGYALLTYASWWIRQSVNRAEDDYGMIRVPVHMNEKLRRVFTKMGREGLPLEEAFEATVREYHEREEELRQMRDPSAAPRSLTKESLDRAVERLMGASHVWKGLISLDTPVNDEEELTFVDCTADPESGVERSTERTDVSSVLTILAIAILALPIERERRIVIERLRERTLEEVGEDFGVTRERIRQIEYRAKETLKRYLRLCDQDNPLRRALLAQVPALSRDDLYMVLHGEHHADVRQRALRALLEEVAIGFRWHVAPSGAEPDVVKRARRSLAGRPVTRPETTPEPPAPAKKRAPPKIPVVVATSSEIIAVPVREPEPAPEPEKSPAPEVEAKSVVMRIPRDLRIRDLLIRWLDETHDRGERLPAYEVLVELVGERLAEIRLADLLYRGALVATATPGRFRMELPSRNPRRMSKEEALVVALIESIRLKMNRLTSLLRSLESRCDDSAAASLVRYRQDLEWNQRKQEFAQKVAERFSRGETVPQDELHALFVGDGTA